jgi:hypothetical protein
MRDMPLFYQEGRERIRTMTTDEVTIQKSRIKLFVLVNNSLAREKEPIPNFCRLG